ncbi:hypothetical protein D3C80_710940 [compost metagenome]
MIKRGPANVKRNHARNFIQKQAQARMDETVAAYNNQVQNSLAVNAVQVVLYQVERMIGRPCSCCKTDVRPVQGMAAGVTPTIPQRDRTNEDLEIQFQDDDIFGSDMDDMIFNDVKVIDVSGSAPSGVVAVTTETDFMDSVGQGSVNCGICYRALKQPGYKAYGMHRKVYTHYDIERIEGTHMDHTSMPHAFEQESPDGFVSFKVTVPKYFVSAIYSIREDTYILREKPTLADGKILTIEDLRRHAGSAIDVYVKTERFTHIVFEFDLGVPRLNANIGGETTTLDYDRLQTMSDIPIVFGPEVSDVNEGDIVCIPERNLFLKIRDKERKIMQDQARLEWVCTARVLQPTEPLRAISKGYKLR